MALSTYGALPTSASTYVQTLQKTSALDAATITLTIGNTNLYAWSASQAQTINASGTQVDGQEITCIITCDATPRVITFNTGFSANGTLTCTASKKNVIRFISSSSVFYEISRVVGLT